LGSSGDATAGAAGVAGVIGTVGAAVAVVPIVMSGIDAGITGGTGDMASIGSAEVEVMGMAAVLTAGFSVPQFWQTQTLEPSVSATSWQLTHLI